jgi:putative phosphoesterase
VVVDDDEADRRHFRPAPGRPKRPELPSEHGAEGAQLCNDDIDTANDLEVARDGSAAFATVDGIFAYTGGLYRIWPSPLLMTPDITDPFQVHPDGSVLFANASNVGTRAVINLYKITQEQAFQGAPRLSEIAPVTAVRGNNDKGRWTARLPQADLLRVGTVFIYVIHDLADLDLDPAAAGCNAVVFGHSHRPMRESRDGVLFVNPGSAGPRRFTLPVSLGYLLVSGDRIDAGLIELPA